jgi:hypothetical protein
MFAAERAVSLEIDSLRVLPLVFGRGIISLLAHVAGQGDDFSGHDFLFLQHELRLADR